ncbi:MAG: hypothetical protein KBB11_01785 [Bacteroidales bacterium]|nr:hypothetical protein [Bacteroidales bacterium]HOY38194.1 hypothetical protein [Bacteroidales bacterium]HQP02997.1 hypothetical protein [Bacteroidales bacterium]
MKSKIFFFFVIVISAGMFFTSCETEDSTDVNQDRIYAYYELFYSADQDVTFARASFRFGGITGTLLELTSPAYVKFNDNYMTYKPALAYYEASFPGLVAEGDFTYYDLDSNIFVNHAVMHAIDLEETLDTIVRGHVYELSFTGDSLRWNEIATAFINSSLGTDLQTFLQSELLSKSIIMPSERTLSMTQGVNTVYVKRNYTNQVEEATTVGAEIHSIWQSHSRQVYVDVE